MILDATRYEERDADGYISDVYWVGEVWSKGHKKLLWKTEAVATRPEALDEAADIKSQEESGYGDD